MVLSENYSKTKRFRPLGAPKRARFFDHFVYFLVIILVSFWTPFSAPSGLMKNLMHPKTLCNNKSGASPAPEAHKVFNKSRWPRKTLCNNNKSGASPAREAHKVFNKSGWPRKALCHNNKSGASPAPGAHKAFDKSGWPGKTLCNNNKSRVCPVLRVHKVFQKNP